MCLTSRQSHLYHKIYECVTSEPFWTSMASILEDPREYFPRSHERTLMCLLGALTWLKPEAKGAVTPAATLEASYVSNARQAARAFLDSKEPKPPHAIELAEELIDETRKSLTIRDDPLQGEALKKVEEEISASKVVVPEDAAYFWQALRKIAKHAFNKKYWDAAESAYAHAILEGGHVISDEDISLLHSNQALALLKAGNPKQAAHAAGQAIKFDPDNSKAYYRRALGLLEELPEYPEVIKQLTPKNKEEKTNAANDQAELAETAYRVAERLRQMEPNDDKVSELYERAKERHELFSAAKENMELALQGQIQNDLPMPMPEHLAPKAPEVEPEMRLSELD